MTILINPAIATVQIITQYVLQEDHKILYRKLSVLAVVIGN